MPDPLPCEVYCHTLTDPSVMSAELRNAGYHTLTLFGVHAPARLFAANQSLAREQAKRAALRALQSVLAEPLEDCLAVDAHGRPCVEVMSPLDIEAELGMPGGHIFHGDLSWPWLPDDAIATDAAERWEWPPIIREFCSAAREPCAAVPSAAWVVTMPPERSSRPLSRASRPPS